jgi:hypothetical protein
VDTKPNKGKIVGSDLKNVYTYISCGKCVIGNLLRAKNWGLASGFHLSLVPALNHGTANFFFERNIDKNLKQKSSNYPYVVA